MMARNILVTVCLLVLSCVSSAVWLDLLPKINTTSPGMDWVGVETSNVFNDPCYQYSWIYDQETTTCGDGFCQCTQTAADCSDQPGLTYIPRLPGDISHLDFSLNYIPPIERDFFLNVTSITHLSLLGCKLYHFGLNPFELLNNLTYLVLASNFFGYDELAPVFSLQNLRYLDISLNDLSQMPDDPFNNYTLDHLDTLCLGGNDIKTVHMSSFMQLPRLAHLDLAFNLISSQTFVINDTYLPQLIHLDLVHNSLAAFFDTCQKNGSAFPNLLSLIIDGNRLMQLERYICLPSLQNLMISDILMSTIESDTFNSRVFPSLRWLTFKPLPGLLKEMQNYTFRNAALQKLDMSYSFIDFSSSTIDVDSFAGCPNLTLLSLDGNGFSDVSDDRFNSLFSPISKLTHLSLRNCKLGHVSAAMFTDMTLLQILWLDSNSLITIPDGSFDGLESLVSLSLSNNRIAIIRETTFSSITRQRLVMLDISNNPYSCSCELIWFQWWLTRGGALYFSDPYICDNVPNATVRGFFIEEQSCLLSPQMSKFIIATISMVLLVFFTFTSLYRYRWHLRLVLYEVCRDPEERCRLQRFRQPFDYDVFVSYDSEDLDWVRAHLMPEIEGRMGLKLCIHERDFIPGKHIVDNIADCVKASKKVMMLFSINFTKSHWCQFELAMCLSHVMENNDALLIILLHDVAARDMTPAMMAVMKNMTYIEWGDGPEARASFWRRIQLALHEIIPTV